jgi:hypothetical protein
MPDLKTSLKAKTVQWVLAFAGGGAGLILGMAAIEAFRARPEFLPQLVGGGGLWFAALVVGMVMFRSEMKSFNAVQTRSVVAQERLAENVGGLVEKIALRDEAVEQRAREQELTLNHLARQVDLTLGHIVELRRERGLN